MPVKIVLDHPRRYIFRRLWRRILMVIGAVLLVVGIAASTVAVPAERIFICRHDRALQIVAAAAWFSASSFDDDMGRLLEMEEILAYTTDRSGIRRFARALRGTLLSRAA